MLSNNQGRSEVFERMLRDIQAEPELEREEEARLCHAASRGDREAARRLVAGTLGRVLHVAQGYRNMGLPLEDLVHEGALGLLQSVGRFDPDRGVRFFTYAGFLVRRNMVQAISRGTKTVRVPRHLSARARRVKEERQRLSAGAGRTVSVIEAARAIGLDADEARACAEFQAPYELSVDEPLGPDEQATRASTLPADPSEGPDCLYEILEACSELEQALARLSSRDRHVIEQRFGLTGAAPRTLRDLSSRMSLSKERVRQLEERAKSVLREHLAPRRHPLNVS